MCKRLRPEHIATMASGQEFYNLFLDINVTTFTYINIVHKTRNSNLHPRTSWQTTSQYYFPVYTTWYYTACTQYYFALQSLQKLLPNITLYYKTCTKYFPVLLCTTKLALHKVVPSILQFAASKPDLDATAEKKTICKHFEKGFVQGKLLAPKLRRHSRKKDDLQALWKRICTRKIASTKIAKICWQITVAAWMQPLQYDLRDPAAKDNSIT